MTAQKDKKKMLTEIFGIFEHLLTQNPTNSSRPYRRLLENPKRWGSRELFLPENDFKTCSTVSSSIYLKYIYQTKAIFDRGNFSWCVIRSNLKISK